MSKKERSTDDARDLLHAVIVVLEASKPDIDARKAVAAAMLQGDCPVDATFALCVANNLRVLGLDATPDGVRRTVDFQHKASRVTRFHVIEGGRVAE